MCGGAGHSLLQRLREVDDSWPSGGKGVEQGSVHVRSFPRVSGILMITSVEASSSNTQYPV